MILGARQPSKWATAVPARPGEGLATMARNRQKSMVVPEVDETHAERFVNSLYRRIADSGNLDEALAETKIMTWPTEPDEWTASQGDTPEQRAFIATQDEI